jgi:hypothetical protein
MIQLNYHGVLVIVILHAHMLLAYDDDEISTT